MQIRSAACGRAVQCPAATDHLGRLMSADSGVILILPQEVIPGHFTRISTIFWAWWRWGFQSFRIFGRKSLSAVAISAAHRRRCHQGGKDLRPGRTSGICCPVLPEAGEEVLLPRTFADWKTRWEPGCGATGREYIPNASCRWRCTVRRSAGAKSGYFGRWVKSEKWILAAFWKAGGNTTRNRARQLGRMRTRKTLL